MACNSCSVDKCVSCSNSNFCQSHQTFGSLRSSYADLASNYSCNYHNLETLNDELRTKTEQDLFLFHVNIRSVINTLGAVHRRTGRHFIGVTEKNCPENNNFP